MTGRIYPIRGHKVMPDRDLAALYGVETRVLKQAVENNLRSPIMTSSWGGNHEEDSGH